MKFYGNVRELETLIKNGAHPSIKQAVNTMPTIEVDEKNNLILEDLDHYSSPLDSNKAFAIADYYMGMGIALQQIEKETNQKPKNAYVNDPLRQLAKESCVESFVQILMDEKKLKGIYINDSSKQIVDESRVKSFVQILMDEKKRNGLIEEDETNVFHMKLNIPGTTIEEELYKKVGL